MKNKLFCDIMPMKEGAFMSENSCYTYFRITGNFDPDLITERLGLVPEKYWKIGDSRHDGTLYDFASWEIGLCEQYDVLVENQMHTTIAPLLNKIDILNEIKNEFDVDYILEIVPTVYTSNSSPCLAPSLKVIDFCHATRTKIDIDLYVMDQE
ncbi:MAG: DUF4279 domain-containing protein [Clostridia bacterium]|nr:DUF4279 domain-containing protein [Clostridia bacterium]